MLEANVIEVGRTRMMDDGSDAQKFESTSFRFYRIIMANHHDNMNDDGGYMLMNGIMSDLIKS